MRLPPAPKETFRAVPPCGGTALKGTATTSRVLAAEVSSRTDRNDDARRGNALVALVALFALAFALALSLALALTLSLALTLTLTLTLALTLTLTLALALALSLSLALPLIVVGCCGTQATDTGDPEEYCYRPPCPALADAMHLAPSPVVAGNRNLSTQSGLVKLFSQGFGALAHIEDP